MSSFSWNNSLLRHLMVSNGWCPQQVHSVFRNHDVLVAYYLSQLRRHSQSGVTHELCNMTKCTAHNADLGASYQQSHTCPDCDCSFIGVSTEVCDILEQGDVPLVSIEKTKDGRITVKLTRMTVFSDFVAISHIWADGLGNPSSNKLPTCEIRRLGERVSKLPTDINMFSARDWIVFLPHWLSSDNDSRNHLFWIDTLCIPVSKSKDQQVSDRMAALKSVAIDRMVLIYSFASRILILDSELACTRIKEPPMSNIEVQSREAFSNWTRRCWTFHEGALAQKCHFQFADDIDTPVPYSHVGYSKDGKLDWEMSGSRRLVRARKEALEKSDPSVEGYLDTRLQRICKDTMQMANTESEMSNCEKLFRATRNRDLHGIIKRDAHLDRLCTVWNHLAERFTTQDKDIASIFANLLEFNSHQIRSLEQDYQLLPLLFSFRQLPLGLLFNQGPRLNPSKDHSNRWVPASKSSLILDQKYRTRLDDNRQYLTIKKIDGLDIHLLDSAFVRTNTTFYVPWQSSDRTRLFVESRFEEDDEMDIRLFSSCLLLTLSHEIGKVEGCIIALPKNPLSSFSITESGLEDQKHMLKGISMVGKYCCPVVCSMKDAKNREQIQIAQEGHLEDDWELKISCGKSLLFIFLSPSCFLNTTAL